MEKKNIIIILLVITAFGPLPFLTIASLNVLLSAHIVYSFATYNAALFLSNLPFLAMLKIEDLEKFI